MKILFALFLSLIIAASGLAQERIIKQEKFDSIYQASLQMLEGKSYREIQTAQSTRKDASRIGSKAELPADDFSFKSITEFLPNVGSHSIIEFISPLPSSKIETIKTADKTYTRKDDGEWTDRIHRKGYPTARDIHIIYNRVRYKFIKREKLGNQKTKVYAKLIKSLGRNPTTNQRILSLTTVKYWFAADGILLKTKSEKKSYSGNMVDSFLSITTNELDFQIKIEVPKLALIK